MHISLIGYMGSGKSHISKILSTRLNLKKIDLDKAISDKHNMPISQIFQEKGEIYFRKEEKLILEDLLASEEDLILSLGGGTPVYYNNIETINNKSKSVFLRASVGTLADRLMKQKDKRPLIAKLQESELPEFIAKHLFERNPFYNQAHIVIDTDGKTDLEIAEEIAKAVNHHPHQTI